MMDDCWRELPPKTKLLYIAACLSFVAGWVITFLAFYAPPLGIVDNTVLIVLGQALTFTASAFGLDKYIEYKISKNEPK